MLVLGEEGEPLFQKRHKLRGHLVQFVHEAIRVHVTETRADGVVDKHNVGKLVPGAVVVNQCVLVLEAVGAELHHGAVFGTAAGTTVEPDDCPLPVGNVLVLEVPEEHVAIVFGGDLNVAGMHLEEWPWRCAG